MDRAPSPSPARRRDLSRARGVLGLQHMQTRWGVHTNSYEKHDENLSHCFE